MKDIVIIRMPENEPPEEVNSFADALKKQDAVRDEYYFLILKDRHIQSPLVEIVYNPNKK